MRTESTGRLDLLRPSLRQSWGGPLNGQQQRQAIVRRLANAITFDAVIETGTYRGTSTEFFSTVFGTPVETVEQNVRYYTYAKARLSRDPQIEVALGDSRTFLREVGLRRSGQTVFVYLDAHWEEDLPLSRN
jgi:predicted O-methyltransferase YrrM